MSSEARGDAQPFEQEPGGSSSVSRTQGTVWSGIALESDSAVREFEEDPAEYMGRKASTLRYGEFESVRAQLSQEAPPTLLKRMWAALPALQSLVNLFGAHRPRRQPE